MVEFGGEGFVISRLLEVAGRGVQGVEDGVVLHLARIEI